MQTGFLLGLSGDNILIYLLTVFRIAGFFAIAPLFGHLLIPVKLKLLLVFMLAYFLFSSNAGTEFALEPGLLPLAFVGIREFLVGLTMGFLFQVIFIGVQFGGGVIGYQIGFAMANVIDPMTSTNISLIAQIKLLIATLIFLSINGHHVMLQALWESYQLVPLGTVTFNGSVVEAIIHFTGKTFIIGIKLAAPVIVTLFCTDVCLGIVARTMPQMNVFIVGFPLKIGVGLFVMGTTLPLFNYVFTKLLNSMNTEALEITRGLTG